MNNQVFGSAPDRIAALDEQGSEERPRVLLVEDDIGVRNMLCRVLQRWSFAVTAVATVEEARSRIAAGEEFAVVLSDYDLPDGNGLEVLYWWKWHRGIELPFLLMSGSASLEPEPSHEVEFLLKPFEMEDLHARLIRLSMSHDCSERMAAADR